MTPTRSPLTLPIVLVGVGVAFASEPLGVAWLRQVAIMATLAAVFGDLWWRHHRAQHAEDRAPAAQQQPMANSHQRSAVRRRVQVMPNQGLWVPWPLGAIELDCERVEVSVPFQEPWSSPSHTIAAVVPLTPASIPGRAPLYTLRLTDGTYAPLYVLAPRLTGARRFRRDLIRCGWLHASEPAIPRMAWSAATSI